jgi:hypothetical protein
MNYFDEEDAAFELLERNNVKEVIAYLTCDSENIYKIEYQFNPQQKQPLLEEPITTITNFSPNFLAHIKRWLARTYGCYICVKPHYYSLEDMLDYLCNRFVDEIKLTLDHNNRSLEYHYCLTFFTKGKKIISDELGT